MKGHSGLTILLYYDGQAPPFLLAVVHQSTDLAMQRFGLLQDLHLQMECRCCLGGQEDTVSKDSMHALLQVHEQGATCGKAGGKGADYTRNMWMTVWPKVLHHPLESSYIP